MARVVSGRTFWVVIGVVVLALCGYALFVAGGGAAPGWLGLLLPPTLDPLGASSPEEQVLRSMRLAGIDHALAGEQGGHAVVRLELPAVNSAPDLELAWQAGIASLAVAYPSADEYVVQVFLDSVGLLEVSATGADGRAAADGEALARDDLRFAYLTTAADLAGARAIDEGAPSAPSRESTPSALGYVLRGIAGNPWHPPVQVPAGFGTQAQALAQARPPSATSLPPAIVSVGLDLPAGYLDAKNRAAGFVREDGQLSGTAAELVSLAEEARSNAPGIPALAAGTDPARFWAETVAGLLANSRPGVDGADDMLQALADTATPESDPRKVSLVRAVAMTVMAVESDGFGDNVAAFADLSQEVADVPLPAGPAADAVLVAACCIRAPEDAKQVVLFERVESLDRDPDALEDSVGDALPAWDGASFTYGAPDAPVTVAPELWLGYRRADGREYLLAGANGPVALTDASLTGWAYEMPRIAIVDAADVGSVKAYLGAVR